MWRQKYLGLTLYDLPKVQARYPGRVTTALWLLRYGGLARMPWGHKKPSAPPAELLPLS